MDGIQNSLKKGKESQAPTLIIASTENPKEIDEALRRSGRFDYEFWVGVELKGPNAISQRKVLLTSLFTKLPLDTSVNEKFIRKFYIILRIPLNN